MAGTSPLDDWLALKLGESDNEIELETRAETQHAVDLMVKQTTDSLNIFSRELDAALYDRPEFLAALNHLCTDYRNATVRILSQNPKVAVGQGHRLIELSRKLASSIEIRHVHADYRYYNEAFLIADACGLVHRTFADRFEGTANFNDPVKAQRRLDFFTEVWERSEPHPDLRRLHI